MAEEQQQQQQPTNDIDCCEEGSDYDSEPDTTATTNDLVDCYNCTGAKMRTMCGFPELGCELCRTHGNGYGRLHKDYRYVEVTVNGTLYKPPAYSCLKCQDVGHIKAQLWIESLVDRRCSNIGRAMPYADLPCPECRGRTLYNEAYNIAVEFFLKNGKLSL